MTLLQWVSSRRSAPWWLAGLALVLAIRFPIHFVLSPPFLMDFEVYRAVAQRLLDGHAAALYAPTTSETMMFKYAPLWALAWLPFAILPHHAAMVVWSLLTVAWVTLAAWLALAICRRAGWSAPGWLAVAAVAILVRPLTAEFSNGQVDALWAALTTLALWAAAAGWLWIAAGALTLAITLKLPAVVFLGWALIRRPALAWRTLACLAGLLLLGSALVWPAHPLTLVRDWLAVVFSSGHERAFEIGNQTLLTLLARFLTADRHGLNIATWPISVVSALAAAIAVALSALIVWPRPRPSSDVDAARLALDGALLSVVMVVCSPTSWVATYTALLLPTMIAGAVVLGRWPAWARDPLAWLGAAVVLAGSVGTHSAFWRRLGIPAIRGETYVFQVVLALPWLALGLYALLWALRRQTAASADAGTGDTLISVSPHRTAPAVSTLGTSRS